MQPLLVTPHMSEKAVSEAAGGIYMFRVPDDANKQQIADAVSEQYGVTVVDVRSVRRKGKQIRAYRGRGRFAKGTRKTAKQAYVRLAEGESIPVFEEAKS